MQRGDESGKCEAYYHRCGGHHCWGNPDGSNELATLQRSCQRSSGMVAPKKSKRKSVPKKSAKKAAPKKSTEKKEARKEKMNKVRICAALKSCVC